MIGMDYKGFGHSEGTRGWIDDRDQFYEDGYRFLTRARTYYEGLFGAGNIPKFFTMGYS